VRPTLRGALFLHLYPWLLGRVVDVACSGSKSERQTTSIHSVNEINKFCRWPFHFLAACVRMRPASVGKCFIPKFLRMHGRGTRWYVVCLVSAG
jgi:hypothetical protein